MEAERPSLDDLKRAVNDGDAAAIRALLETDADLRTELNAPNFAFDSPALVAAARGNVDVIDTLLAFGADPNRKSDWWAGGFHPLHVACGAVADRLLAAGAVPDACAAAHIDRADLLEDMLSADPHRVHERGGDGQTPLHFARSRTVVDLLLAAGADLDARDVDHRSTPAQWMLGPDRTSRTELAHYLVERGASADIFLLAALGLTDRVTAMLTADPSLLALRTSQGDYGEQPPSSFQIYEWTIGPNVSPLQTALKFGRPETLAAMERFASTQELLMLACHRGDRRQARAIVDAHPGIVAALGPNERGALTDAAWLVNVPAVELMLELGFDPSVPSGSRPNALHCAAWEGSAGCVAALLRYPAGRALIETHDPTFNATPLGWCSHGSLHCGSRGADHAEVARRLIAAGARADPRMATEGSATFQAQIRAALA